MPQLSRYVLAQLVGPTALFAFLLSAVIWLTQSLRLLDLVINRGQSAPTFVYLSILILPSLLVIILPIAYFAGTLFALNKLHSDSEMVAMHAAGYSQNQLLLPVFLSALFVMGATYACGLWLMPAGERQMKATVLDIRADIGAALLNQGVFNTPAKGLTVFIRELDANGDIRGVLVHDNRNRKRPVTYLAERGRIAQTPAGARLMMFDGTVEQSGTRGSDLSVLQFKSYVFDLDQFSSPLQATNRATSERYLGELLHPEPGMPQKARLTFLAEAHNRLSQPLYCIAFALIAVAAVTKGKRARGAHAMRLTIAALAALGLRIAGYGVQALATSHPAANSLFYIIPAFGALMALADLTGHLPSLPDVFGSKKQTEPAP